MNNSAQSFAFPSVVHDQSTIQLRLHGSLDSAVTAAVLQPFNLRFVRSCQCSSSSGLTLTHTVCVRVG